jgi:hypothetical protein
LSGILQFGYVAPTAARGKLNVATPVVGRRTRIILDRLIRIVILGIVIVIVLIRSGSSELESSTGVTEGVELLGVVVVRTNYFTAFIIVIPVYARWWAVEVRWWIGTLEVRSVVMRWWTVMMRRWTIVMRRTVRFIRSIVIVRMDVMRWITACEASMSSVSTSESPITTSEFVKQQMLFVFEDRAYLMDQFPVWCDVEVDQRFDHFLSVIVLCDLNRNEGIHVD